jgi:hypothetical protein
MTSVLKKLMPRVFVVLVSVAASMSLILVSSTSPSFAAESVPTLTVHVASNSSLDGYDDSSLADQILPTGAKSAGAGYVYKLTQLDTAKVNTKLNGDAASSEKITSEILAHSDDYLLPGTPEVYGVSDTDGIIATTGTTAQGSWVKGAQLSQSGVVEGGTPMVFSGTAYSPTFWLMELVRHPAGVEVKDSAGLVELPYSAQAASVGDWNYDVNLFPKLAVTSSSVPPDDGCPTCVTPTTKLPSKLAQTGSSVLFIVGIVCAALGIGLLLRHKNERHRDTGEAS